MIFYEWCQHMSWIDLTHDVLDESLPLRMGKMRELSSGFSAGLWLASPSRSHSEPKWSCAEWQVILQWRLGTRHFVMCGQAQDRLGQRVGPQVCMDITMSLGTLWLVSSPRYISLSH